MRWYAFATLNTVKQMLPLQSQLRAIKRKWIPYSTEIDTDTLNQGLDQVDALREAGTTLEGKRLLELGTGWKPVIPLIFSLAGCGEVLMVDAQRLMDSASFAGVCRNLAGHAKMIAERLGMTAQRVEDILRQAAAMPFDQALAMLKLRYLAPCDARHTGLPDGAIDVVTSRAVLEHVPLDILEQLFAEFHRVLNPRGKMCHVIDNSDHWRQKDPSISFANFLQYSDRVWRLAGINPLDYMNRLRHSDYLALFQRTGFEVCVDRSRPHEETLRALGSIELAPRFRDKAREDLAIITSFVVGAKIETASAAATASLA